MLLKIPGDLHETGRDSNEYPYEAYKYYDGVRFFTTASHSLLTDAEMEEALRKEAAQLEAEAREVWGRC